MNAKKILKTLLSEYNLSDYIYDVKEREGLGWEGPKVCKFAELLSEASKCIEPKPLIQDAIGREITVYTPFLWLRWIGGNGIDDPRPVVVYPGQIEGYTKTSVYQISGTTGTGGIVTIELVSGKNPSIYKLANNVGEL